MSIDSKAFSVALPPNLPRRATRAVRVGDLVIGGGHPILIQSMTIADTMDTDAVVAETRALVDAGCPLVRITAPSDNEARNLRTIRDRLRREGITVPLVADIHFTPNAALIAAEIVEKVRVNPGNYADRKKFLVREYTDSEYGSELERLRDRFRPLVQRCKESGCAMRIGTNHGSLSDRIMNRYGDTPEGMVESALEFVRICEDEGYREIVLSMKSSVPSVMIAAYRLLARRLDELGMDYPLHLGVTEAGDGLEGRVKSAIGIGSLLLDGIGDTIRVSLTEDSHHEIPAAEAILQAIERQREALAAGRIQERIELSTDPTRARRRSGSWVLGQLEIGGSAPVRVELRCNSSVRAAQPRNGDSAPTAEFLSFALESPASSDLGERARRARAEWIARCGLAPETPCLLELGPLSAALAEWIPTLSGPVQAVGIELGPEFDRSMLAATARALVGARLPLRLRLHDCGPATAQAATARAASDVCHAAGLNVLGFVVEPGPQWVERARALAASLDHATDLLFLEIESPGPDGVIVAGSALLDGLGDAVSLVTGPADRAWPRSERHWVEDRVASAYVLLQACRLRLTRAEFIACPSCGRTLFDLQTTTARIRNRTEHLAGVKIAVMGCIVNGPGEMADADFGYVGSGVGKIDLYVGKERVRRNVPETEAEDRLVELIREHGRWAEPA